MDMSSGSTACKCCQWRRNIGEHRATNGGNSRIFARRNSVPGGMKSYFIWILTLWLCVIQSCYAAVAPPFITRHPEDDIWVRGNVEVLQCSAIGGHPLQYSWWKDGQGEAFASSNNYRISNVDQSQAGEYRCLVENPVGIIMSKAADIRVAYINSFPSEGSSQHIMAGEATIIECPPIESYPPPAISWVKDGLPVTAAGRIVITLDGRLVIIDTMSGDAGAYVCHAENTRSAYRMESQPISFIVTSPPTPVMNIPPSVIIPPGDVIVHEGESLAELECIINARPLEDLEITWVRGGEVYRSGGLELFKLQIRNPQITDQGTYECQASLKGVTVSASANLTYYTMPTFVVAPEADTVSPVGSTVVIPCQASGTPTPSIVWYRNAADVTTLGDSRYRILSTGSLQIQDLQKPDGAMLQCRIFNEVGEDIKDTQLLVKEIAPEFTIYPNDTLLLVGESAFLECQASGAPVPTIEWYKDGAPVASEGSTSNPRYIFESGNLRINDAVTPDSGVYKCEATNTKGSINVTINFDVYERTYIATRPVDIEEVKSGSTVLDCVVYSDDRITPSTVWYHNDRELDVTDSDISVQSTGSLEIRMIEASDAGNYVCRVTSVAGEDEATAQLSVIQFPFAPVALEAAISSSNSRTIVLQWVAPFNGNTPLLRYIIDQKEDLSSYREIESTVDPGLTSFNVVGVKPSRSYQFRIRAENKVGTGPNSDPSPEVSLPEEPPDDPPQRVVASASSTNTIIVEWQEPPEDTWNGDLLGYIVRHRLYGYSTDWTRMNISNVRQTSVVVAGLFTWERYEIQVAGYNRAGEGTFSDSVKEQTLEGVPSEPPRNVDIRVVNSTAIQFTWMPPSPVAINGINQGYKLHLLEPGMEDDRVEVIIPHTPGASSYSEYVGDLGRYTEYEATVLCYTNPGDGPTSTPRTLRTLEDEPGPVEDLRVTNVQATSLTLEWDAPTRENGILTTYWVEYFPVNDTGAIVTSDLLPDIHHLHVTQLSSETTYSFSVWAETSVGPGDRQTTIIRSGIPPVTPDAPITLAVSDVQSRSAYLQFSPGFNGHASISLWTVEALVGTDTEWMTVFTISAPEANSFVLTSLRPYTDYTFRMVATNVAGDSPPSDESNGIQTLPDVPEIPPSELTVRANDEHSLRVRWVPLAETDWNGIARGYVVFWSRTDKQSGTLERHMVGDSYSSEYLITGLEEYTEYDVTIRAVNNIDEGPMSPTRVETTHEDAPSAGPEGVTASALDHSSIQVAWGNIPSQDQNGIILGYKVLYQESSGSMSDQMELSVEGGDTHETTLSGLEGYTAYTIMVVGRTRLGDGVPSDTITATTLESAPGPPTDITFPGVTETTVRVHWAAPSEPNGVIIDYMITHKVRGATRVINTHVTDNAAVSHYEVGVVQANTYYTFTVTARNRIGWGVPESSDVFTTSQRDVPDPPTNVNVNRVKGRQASLSWTPGDANNAPIRSYRIRLRLTQESWMDHPSSIPHDALSYTITGLKPYTDYQFKIQAKNDVGWSPFSEPSSQVTTQEDAPEGAPSIVNVRPVTTTSVDITWQAPLPETHNGDLLGYKVVFRQLPGDISQSRIVDNPTADSYSLVDLVKFKDYEIKLAAFNSISDGPLSRPWTIFVGEAAPSAPPSGVRLYPDGANGIRVAWIPPPEETLNGGLQGYKVAYWPMSTRKRATGALARTYPSTATDVTLDGLRCATTYGIQVNGFNAAGDGPTSETQIVMTEEDVPGEVAFLAFEKIRMRSLAVSWAVPPKACGSITFYKLSYMPLQTINGEKSSITTEISATKTAYHVMELDPEVPYMFSISARTYSKPQYGPVIERNVTTGPQPGSPESPREVMLTIEDDILTISWEEPVSDGYSPLTGYFIEYQEDQKEWTLLADDIASSERFYSFLFQELKSSTVYSFRVSAENSQGASVPGFLSEGFDTAGIHYTGPQVAFYEEWWFLVIVALVGVIIIILVGATLCMLGRSKLYKEKKKGKRVNHVHQPPNTDDGGFQPMELNPTRRGAPRNGNYPSSNSYRRPDWPRLINSTFPDYFVDDDQPPPKPSPGSVQYSEEEESKHYEPATTRERGETASLTERYPESVGSESEPELREEATDSFVNHYGTLPSANQEWRQQVGAPQAYSYTDSEPDHNSVAMYNNGLVNMEAGSRNPIQGFSSFV